MQQRVHLPGHGACGVGDPRAARHRKPHGDRKSTRLNSSHGYISYAVFCLKKKKTAATTSGNSSTPIRHSQHCSSATVCSRHGLRSFSTGVATTAICDSYKTYAAMKCQSSRLRRYKRVVFHRGTSPESAKKIPIDGLLPHHIKQHAEVCAQKDRDFENEPGQRKQGRTDEEFHSPRDSSGHNARGKWLARAD